MTRAVVIGGGIAGVSVGAELAALGVEVTLVEAEADLAHHTTGRSAAMYLPSYGTPLVRALTAGSRATIEALGVDAGAPLLSPRALLYVAPQAAVPELEELVAATTSLRVASPDEAVDRCPALRSEVLGGAAVDEAGADIDVAAMHQAYVRALRAAGGEIVRGEPVTDIRRAGGAWTVATPARSVACDTVVDAAGAWADRVAVLGGARPVGLRPLRRTLFVCPVRWPHPFDRWPLVADVTWRFYFRPEQGHLLVSPADETLSEPCDARPEQVDIARAIDAVNEATTLEIRTVRSSWAGLRTFSPDGDPVAGCRDGEPGFAWLGGQGGYGIQMAPALARAGAALALGEPVPPDLVALGVGGAALSPARFERLDAKPQVIK
jgi:D-arginine dehydrogenase